MARSALDTAGHAHCLPPSSGLLGHSGRYPPCRWLAGTCKAAQEDDGRAAAAGRRQNHLGQNSTQLSSQKTVRTRGRNHQTGATLKVTRLHLRAGLALCTLTRHANHLFLIHLIFREMSYLQCCLLPGGTNPGGKERSSLLPSVP